MATCKDLTSTHKLFLFPQIGGYLALDMVDPADVTGSNGSLPKREMMISDAANNPVTVLPYFGNSCSFMLTPGVWHLSARKLCTDGTYSDWGYTMTVPVPSVAAPQAKNISFLTFSDHLVVSDKGFKAGVKTAVQYRYKGETAWRFQPRVQGVSFVLPAYGEHLLPGKTIEIQMAYDYPTNVSSGWLDLTANTTPVGLTNLAFTVDGNGLAFDAPIQNTQVEIQVNGITLRYAVVRAGSNGVPLTYPSTGAAATVPGDTVTIIYFGTPYSIKKS